MKRTAQQVAALLRTRIFTFTNEDELQWGLAQVLAEDGMSPRREVRLSPADRVDLLVGIIGGDLAIEVKIAGADGDVRRQLERYAGSDQVAELMLVTTLRRHLAAVGPTIGGKPLTAVRLPGGM